MKPFRGLKTKTIAAAWASVGLWLGCTPTVTNLQTVDVTAAPVRHPIPITQNKTTGKPELRIHTSLNNTRSLETQVQGHTDVNASGEFQVERIEGSIFYREYAGVNAFPFRGDNFVWNIPRWQVNVDIDFPLSKSVALSGGFNYADLAGQGFGGYNLGLGIFGEGQTWAWRLDGRLNFQESRFEASLVRTEDIPISGDESRRVQFFGHTEKETFSNPAFMITLNTRRTDWPLNLFLHYTLGSQTFFDARTEFVVFDRNRDAADFKYTSSYFSFAGGIFHNLDSFGRLLAGFRFTHYDDERNQLSLPHGFVQIDFLLR